MGYGPPLTVTDVPEPPPLTAKNLAKWLGPSAIALGIAIGSGEWLIGPAVYVKYGLSMFWICTISATLQTLMNIEYARYTITTGEPISIGWMRLWPGPAFWAILTSVVGILHVAWPGWAAAGATAITAAQLGRLPTAADKPLVLAWAAVTFIFCMFWLLVGAKVEATLEKVFWATVFVQVFALLVVDILYVPPKRWIEGLIGFFNFGYIPKGASAMALGALAGYAGLGGFYNTAISNYYRDKGYGMGAKVGYIPAVFFGGKKVTFSPVGVTFEPTKENLEKWRQWFKLVRIDQWLVFWLGAMIGMYLPGMLYREYALRPLKGWAVAAVLAEGLAARFGTIAWTLTLAYSFFLLFDTQVGVVETIVRQVTDMAWWGSERFRKWCKEDIRIPYYGVLALLWIWGLIVIATGWKRPLWLLWLGANIANLAFVISAIGTFFTNRKFLPDEVKPHPWRQVVLILAAIFFGFWYANWFKATFITPGKGFF